VEGIIGHKVALILPMQVMRGVVILPNDRSTYRDSIGDLPTSLVPEIG